MIWLVILLFLSQVATVIFFWKKYNELRSTQQVTRGILNLHIEEFKRKVRDKQGKAENGP